jgi:hypothetical protein
MKHFVALLLLVLAGCTPVQAQRFVKTANSWADLLSLNPNDVHTNAFVVYGTTVGDEQGGVFTYFSNSSEATNLQNVFKPYAYNGRWIKQIGNFLTNTYVTNLYASNIYTTNLTVINLTTNYVSTNVTVDTLTATNFVGKSTNITINGVYVVVPNFDPNQFSVLPTATPPLVDVSVRVDATVTNLISRNYLTAEGVFAMGSSIAVYAATAATNDITTGDSSWLEITSDSSVPDARIIRMDAGSKHGQFLIIRNSAGGNTFTLRNSSAVVGGGQVNLSGVDWTALPSESMLLIYDEVFQDWNEIGRFGSGTTAGLVANLTPGYLPYATGTNTLGDSPFYRSSANVIGFGGTTALLTAYDTTGTTNTVMLAWGISTPPAANSVVVGNTNVASFYIGKVGKLSGQNVVFGFDSGKATTSGSANTLVGYNAGKAITTGSSIVAVGSTAGLNLTTPIGGVTLVGVSAGRNLITGQGIAIGQNSLYTSTNGIYNVSIGDNSLYNIQGSGSAYNVAIGDTTGYGLLSASETVLVGAQPYLSGDSTTRTLTDSVWIGHKDGIAALTNWPTTLNNAIVVGHNTVPVASNSAIVGNTNVASFYVGKVGKIDSSDNVAWGTDALKANTTNANVAIGAQAMFQSTIAQQNVAVGDEALYSVTSADVRQVVAVGPYANRSKTSGQSGVAVGANSLFSETTGSQNTAVGAGAGFSVVTGIDNVYVGYTAGYNATSGQNVIVGSRAALSTTSGANNTVVGYSGIQANVTGGDNTVVGSGLTLTTNVSKTVIVGNYTQSNVAPSVDVMTNNIVNSVFIGYKDSSTTNNVPGLTNVVSIGYNTIVTNNNQMALGNSSHTSLLLAQSRGIYWGSGVPAIVANRGSLYLRTDGGAGSTMYVKEADDGASTGWAAK